MKHTMTIALCLTLAVMLFSGCRRNVPENTTQATQNTTPESTAPSTQTPTEPSVSGVSESGSAQLLKRIWDQFGEDERFAAYGGTVEHAVNDMPGDLDLKNTEELTTKYLLPPDRLGSVTEGASLVHLMNNNIFTGAVFRLADGTDTAAFAKALRDSLQKNQWICGSPDRILIATPAEGHLLMAFGASDVMTLFQTKLDAVFPKATVHFSEAVVS